MPPYDATLTKNLRDAGAIIIAKTGMTELANWVAGAPTPMPGNYNAVGGYGFNPYDPRRDPREATVRRTSRAADRRLELRHRHRRELLGRQRRHRNVRIDPEPVESEHARRHQADGRPRQPLRRHSDHRRSGHRRPDGARPSPTPRSCSARSKSASPDPNDPATRHVPAAARPRLHAVSQRRRPEGRAHRHSARVLLRRVTPPGRRQTRAGAADRWRSAAAERRAEDGDDRGDRRAQSSRAPIIVDPADIPSIVDQDPDEQLPALGQLLGREQREGQGRGLLGRCSSTA